MNQYLVYYIRRIRCTDDKDSFNVGKYSVEIVQDIGMVYHTQIQKADVVSDAVMSFFQTLLDGMKTCDSMLPFRYGTFLTRDKMRALLRGSYSTLSERLRRLEGLVEMGVRGMWTPVQKAKDSHLAPSFRGSIKDQKVREYMQARQNEYRQAELRKKRAQEAAYALHVPLDELSVQSTYETDLSAVNFYKGAYLIRNEHMNRFMQCCNTLFEQHPTWHCHCYGPWPPYHFSNISLGRSDQKEDFHDF